MERETGRLHLSVAKHRTRDVQLGNYVGNPMVTGFAGLTVRIKAPGPAKNRTFRTLSAPGKLSSRKLEHGESHGVHWPRSAELDKDPSEAEDSSRNPVSCRKTSPTGGRCWVSPLASD